MNGMHKRSVQVNCAGQHLKHVVAKHMCLETAVVQAKCKLQLVLTCDMSLTCSVDEGTACGHRYCLL